MRLIWTNQDRQGVNATMRRGCSALGLVQIRTALNVLRLYLARAHSTLAQVARTTIKRPLLPFGRCAD